MPIMMDIATFHSAGYMEQAKEIERNPLMRGKHVLPHQSQITKRDLMGEEIARNPGKTCMGYMLSEEQQIEGRHSPYLYLVFSPSSCAMNWTAFETDEKLRAWANAYGITLSPEMHRPGERFDVILPMSTSEWMPLNGPIDARFLAND
jgi:hypothetical protein